MPLDDRWVYASKRLNDDADVDALKDVIETSGRYGLNGLLLSAGFDQLDLQPPDYFERLAKVKALCKANGMEIIPSVFSAGYGGGILSHNRNLAAGLPVKAARYRVQKGEGRLAADHAAGLDGGDLSSLGGDISDTWTVSGDVSVAKGEGRSGDALRFVDGEAGPRIAQEVAVKPWRSYRVTVWMRGEGLAPQAELLLYATVGRRSMVPLTVPLRDADEWKPRSMVFNSMMYDRVRISIGLRNKAARWTSGAGVEGGGIWVDETSLEEVGMLGVLRRPGTPLTVTDESGDTVYEEGRDFEAIPDAHSHPFDPANDELPIKLTSGSRISDGDTLRVTFYHPVQIHRGQMPICMSEPESYEIWRKAIELMHEHLGNQKYSLSMDEVRAGGSCEACRGRGMSLGEIFGDCVTRQYDMIKEVNPDALVYCWSDMMDPNHNCHADYYSADGDFAKAWQHVPKDMIITCWWHAMRDKSLPWFEMHGFRTFAAAYYDGDDLENIKEWLTSIRGMPDHRGIMYTTWMNKYELLPGYGELVQKEAIAD